MKNLTPYVKRAIAGETILAMAEEAGVEYTEMRRAVLVDPDYDEARDGGLIRGPGRPPTASNDPRTPEAMRAHPAVVAVVEEGMTQAAAAEKYGMYQVKLSRWLDKAYPDFVPASGRGRPRGSANKTHANTSPAPDIKGMLPVISWVQAGHWADPEYQAHEGPESYRPCPVPYSPNSFILRVEGDSMVSPHGRAYPPGCLVYVDPEKRSPVNGDRVIAKLEGSERCTFKVFKNEDDRTWLTPLNPQHPTMHEKFSIVGTVIGKWEDG